MKVVFLISFTFLSIYATCQGKFMKNCYIAGVSPNELLNQLNDMDYFFVYTEEIKVSSDFVKTHKIRSITEKKINIQKNKNTKDTTYQKTYFNRNGFPTKIEYTKNRKSIDQYCEFEYDENNNITTFCAYNDFSITRYSNLIIEIKIDNEFNNNLLVHQNIRHVRYNCKYKKRIIDSMENAYFHDIKYSLDDSIGVVTVKNDFDTLFRKAHVKILHRNLREVNCNYHNLPLKNKDTLLCSFFRESEMWAMKRVFNKEYDSLGYLIRMDATLYKENSLENYDSLKCYNINSIDTINDICPFFFVKVVTKGSLHVSDPDSTMIYPEYTSDTVNVQYQFYYMDDANYSSKSKTILGCFIYNDKGEKINKNERSSMYCRNFYNANGLIEKQFFTLRPFWVKQEDNIGSPIYSDPDYCTLFEFEYY